MNHSHAKRASGISRPALTPVELRAYMGLDSTAPLWVRLLVYAALSSMVLTRKKIGVRMVGLPRLAGSLLLMTIWGLALSILASGFVHLRSVELPSFSDLAARFMGLPQTHPLLIEGQIREFILLATSFAAPMAFYCAVVTMIGASQRLVRWVKRQSGEQLNTQSLGISVVQLVPGGNDGAERYLHALIVVVAGALIWRSSFVLGSWLILSAIALYTLEKCLHEVQLDQYDGLLVARAHESITASYLSGLSEGKTNEQTSLLPLPTGVSADVNAAMKRREKLARTSPPPTAKPSPNAAPAYPDEATMPELAVTDVLPATDATMDISVDLDALSNLAHEGDAEGRFLTRLVLCVKTAKTPNFFSSPGLAAENIASLLARRYGAEKLAPGAYEIALSHGSIAELQVALQKAMAEVEREATRRACKATVTAHAAWAPIEACDTDSTLKSGFTPPHPG